MNKLQQFKDREGHCKVPKSHKEDGYGLGGWVNSHRARKDKLSPERIKELDALDFVWNIRDFAWEESFAKLQQFKDREGHCKVSDNHRENGIGL